jgi:hypothetical protein
MPTLVWLYLTALLYSRTSASCGAVAEALESVSHDRLTRLLQGNWSGQTRLEFAWRTLFVWERGYLIIDDTVIPSTDGTRHPARTGHGYDSASYRCLQDVMCSAVDGSL